VQQGVRNDGTDMTVTKQCLALLLVWAKGHDYFIIQWKFYCLVTPIGHNHSCCLQFCCQCTVCERVESDGLAVYIKRIVSYGGSGLAACFTQVRCVMALLQQGQYSTA
jgi:hypothetical protein